MPSRGMGREGLGTQELVSGLGTLEVEGEEGEAPHGEALHGEAPQERGAPHGVVRHDGVRHDGVQHEDGELRDHDGHGAPRGRRRRQPGLTNSVQPETKQQKPRMESLPSGLILRLI